MSKLNDSLVGSISQDNLLYGKLNKEYVKNSYTGGETNTAKVTVDNANNIITVDAKADMSEIQKELDKLNAKIGGKAKGLYYDALKELETKSYWYLTSEINEQGQGTKESIISGPYDLGQGGGGGGGVTKVTVEAVDWPSAISAGTECIIKVNWKSLKDERPTGNGTISVYVNDSLAFSKRNVPQGIVELDITNFLTSTTNFVEVRATDSYGTMDKVVGQIDAVEVKLESNFDENRIFSGTFNYTCIPYATGTKTVYYYVDGTLAGTEIVKTSGEQITKQFSGWSHGDHKLEVYFTCVIGEQQVQSNHLTYSLIYEVIGDNTPIIASTFNKLEQEQYISFSIPYKVYTPNHSTSRVDLVVNGTIIRSLDVNQTLQYWEYKSNTVGNVVMKIQSGTTSKQWTVNVKESEVPIEPVSQDLALALNTIGRSNSEPAEERVKWQDIPRGINCTLSNFNFTSDGWVKDNDNNTVLRLFGNARVTIPYKPFDKGKEIRDTGKTIELEIATSEIMDYEAVILSCFDGERGFYITPQLGVIKSQSSYLQTQYKEDDHVRLTFVIEKKNENRLILMYINGIMSGAVRYPENDDFSQNNPLNISIGSNSATVDIYNIRIYDNNLNRRQVVNNWIADTQSGELKKIRYVHNDNYNDAGEIDIAHLPSDIPYMVWDMDVLPQYKGDKRPGDVQYVDQQDDTRNFTSENATYNVQGTSSSVYPVKNIRIKYKKNKDWPERTFKWYDKDGNDITKFAITKGEIGDNYFTYKVDFASSEGANNVELVKLYNDASKEYGIKTPPQKLNNQIRVGINGFPIVAFHKGADDKIKFCTKANFNNDKANEGVYGFDGGDESWEITNNTSDLGKFKIPATAENFSEAFEIRFPDEDGYSSMTLLNPMTTWVASTYRDNATGAEITPVTFTYTETVRSEDGSYSTREVTKSFDHDTKEYRLTKFKAELKNWFNVDSTLFYYIFTNQFLMIDSRAKNAFPTYFKSRAAGDGGDRWFWLPYDMDTAIGIDNKGKLSFDYNLEDTDTIECAAVFNGQDSVMWNNVRDAFDGEIGEMYSKLRTQGLFSYDVVEQRFEKHQEKWSENIFNEDSKVKYIDTLQGEDNYLEMLQGGKVEQRKWWLYNRFKYMDSKYTAGEAKSDFIQFRAYVESGVDKPSITITPYADIYATVSYANGAAGTKSKRAKRGEPVTIVNPFKKEEAETDQETYIYSASQLKSIGDISPFKPDTVKVGNATKLQELKIGDSAESYSNPHLTELTLGNNILLKKLDVRNCTNLSTSINIKACKNIEEVYFDGTKITELELPDGGILKKLHLPDTITTLIVRNQPLLNEFVLDDKSNISKLWLENIPSELIDAREIISEMKTGSRIRLIGFNMIATDANEIKTLYDRLDTMSGINAQGGNVDKAQVNGKIYIDTISYSDYVELSARYVDVQIIATKIMCTVKFLNEGAEFNTQLVVKGQSAVNPGIPHKNSTAQFYYDFEKWDKSYENVQTNLEINAEFSTHTQIYTFKFDPQTTLVDPIPDETVEYNNLLPVPPEPHIEGAIFNGWFKEPETINKFDFDIPVTGPFNPDPNDKPLPITLYGKWTDEFTPVVNITVEKYNKFNYVITDNIAVTSYAITTSPEEPTEWISITPTGRYEGSYTVTTSGVYYVWGRDDTGFIGSANVNSYALNKDVADGSEITLTQGGEVISNFVLQGLEIVINASLDTHYENLKLCFNDVEIPSGTAKIIEENSSIKTTCTPKSYTVKFEIGAHGTPVEDQTIVYKQKVRQPQNQYDSGYITDGWYREQGLINKWDFETDTVSGDMTLYAKWVIYSLPSKITIEVGEEKQFKCNLYQSSANGVEVYWGDGTEKQTIAQSGDVSFTHTFTSSGTYVLEIACKEGIHYLGRNYDNQCVVPASSIKHVEFAFNMPYTRDYAFRGATNLEEINLTDYMTSVSVGTFQNCTKVSSLTIPNNITELKDSCFSGCTGILGTQIISNNITKMGTQIFFGCTGISKFILPNTIQSIGESSFRDCTSLVEINIPTSLKKIETLLFSGAGLSTIDIPDTVEEFGQAVFAGCPNLEKVILRSKELKMQNLTFNNCQKIKTAGPIGGDYNIEFAWDKKVPNNAFECGYTQSYLLNVVLPDSIEEIGSRSFLYCGRLENINMPANLKKIGANSFERCSSLISTLDIPSSCTEINQNAFIWCTGLQRVNLHNTVSTYKVDTYLSSWFYHCAVGLILHIPKSLATIEDAKMAYGNCWNFYNDGLELTYYNDLD